MGNSREKWLLGLTILLAVAFGGYYVYQNYGESLGLSGEDVDSQREAILELQAVREEAPRIRAEFEAMDAELKLEGNDSMQTSRFREIVTAILNDVQLTPGQITEREHNKRNEDFKIISLSIDQIICTPQQLGELLFRMERESSVMEIEECSIQNQMRELGDIAPRFRNANNMTDINGVLVVDLVLSRLVEYRQDEKDAQRRRNRRR